MQAVESITMLIALGDQALKLNSSIGTDTPELSDSEQQLSTAVAVAQAMLNTALPVARFRAFVKYESGKEQGREFTVCGVNIEDIVVALYPMTQMSREVYVTLWEQRSTGADMLKGFQGRTRQTDFKRPKMFRAYLDSLQKYSVIHLAN